MMNTTQKSVILIAVFLISCTCVILMAVSFGTECWLTETTPLTISGMSNLTTTTTTTAATTKSTVKDFVSSTNVSSTATTNATTVGTTAFVTSGTAAGSSVGSTSNPGPVAKRLAAVTTDYPTVSDGTAAINLGLFTGFVDFQFFIPTQCSFTVFQKVVVNKGLYVVTVIFFVLSVVLAVVSAVFAAINSAMTPIEEITGLAGLYVWNGAGAVCDLAGILCFIGLWASNLANINFVNNAICSSSNTAALYNTTSSFDYSFYIPIGVFFLFIVNIGLVYLTTRSLEDGKSQAPIDFGDDDDHNQGVIMLF